MTKIEDVFMGKHFLLKYVKEEKIILSLKHQLCVAEEATPIHTYKEAQVVLVL